GKITVQDLAEIACMSQTHFTRVFKKELGKTPMEYLNRIRMERVKKLLLAGDKSITEIALECGFGSAAYLSASFRKTYRTSPSDYLKTFKKGLIPKKNGWILKD
ncbi:MAG: helix-turn-helix transcriptional regulator, partial [Deltaproteobacteria bacterium]|nr:helix-turn-helix transcriptional regulator [Deltaproteobacteria bacterium]